MKRRVVEECEVSTERSPGLALLRFMQLKEPSPCSATPLATAALPSIASSLPIRSSSPSPSTTRTS
jgi:hypothetical protein